MKNNYLLSLLVCVFISGPVLADSNQGIYQGGLQSVRFDESPPLKSIVPLAIPKSADRGGLIVDPDGLSKPVYGPQDVDPVVQQEVFPRRIPAPGVSFNGPTNLSGVSPPDPVGDIGPNHYVVMSNLFFEIYDRSGTSVFGPAANNTIWSGFGGECETQNSGDPIVLYDQLADRWLLTQFTSNGSTLYNCVALSTTADPTGTYYRWAISNGAHFPDYPKYGVGTDAYYISTRDFQNSSYVGIGVYALNKAEMIAGNPNPTIVNFFVDRTVESNVGDGLLPMDIDGFDLPPNGSAHYFLGTMDDGGPYSAPQDALTLWKFVVDFATPANSSFTLANTINVAAFDTIYPCPGGGRNCIQQPDTTNMLDIQSYRQRALHRLAYRNFGDHEALVANQSVEASANVAGIRWWEIRSPASNPVVYQEGTYGPGVTDGIHRWMGSIAMDSAGNIGLAYSASSTTLYPSLRYTGRLSSDPLGTMAQGEEIIHTGTGSQTGSQRWGDYSSLNVDPTDDCTFWYTNEYVPSNSSNGWQLRIGSFRFNECGTPGFTLSSVSPSSQSACIDETASYNLNVGSIAEFDSPVTLALTGAPATSTAQFSLNPVTPLPGTSTLQVGNLTGVAAGTYAMQLDGTATGADPRQIDLELKVFTAEPPQSTLISPTDTETNVDYQPSFSWSDVGAESYIIEVATDALFANIVFTQTVNSTTVAPGSSLDSNSTYYWRVIAQNACGAGLQSATFSFVTKPAPGDCPAGVAAVDVVNYDFESGEQGWVHSALTGTDTWVISSSNPHSGTQSFHAEDLATESDQILTSPPVNLPTGQSPLTFQFWNDQTLEDRTGGCWDAGILEISTDGGASFAQVDGADLLTDPYDGPINGGPLQGSPGWCGDPQPYLNSIIDLDALAGQTVMFRFRVSTDGSVGRVPGWKIDDVKVRGCLAEEVFQDGFE
ncbi:MAG: hypothetical protein ACWA5R_04290 [bacterium]